ncbi:MAG: beta strand repeat-containing protein, partial [Anaerolineae bacterium]
DSLTIDASSAGVILDGSGTPSGTVGLQINGAIGVVIKGLQVLNFPNVGINITNGAKYNLIGGVNAAQGSGCAGDCNLISGNGDDGVLMADNGTMSNTISGNYIGTDISGMVAIANAGVGVWIGNGAQANFIGGSTPGERNLISGNLSDGVSINDSGTMSNTVSGNYIGVNISGTTAISNAFNGVIILSGASNNLIGGSTPGEGNLISGNGDSGVSLSDSGTMSNTVRGNYIGTDVSGTSPLGNNWDGVFIGNDASFNTVEDNLISGQARVGVSLNGQGNASQGNVVRNNFIGTDAAGTAAVGNGWNDPYTAVEVYYTADNIIEDNLISGNYGAGIVIQGITSTGNIARGNTIGLNISRTTAIPNGNNGVRLENGANGNTIGGVNAAQGSGCAGDCNLISGNGDNGVELSGSGVSSNTVRGNWIGPYVGGGGYAYPLDAAIAPGYPTDCTLYVASAASGVRKSTDCGLTWSAANAGLSQLRLKQVEIPPDAADANTAFALAENG